MSDALKKKKKRFVLPLWEGQAGAAGCGFGSDYFLAVSSKHRFRENASNPWHVLTVRGLP